MRRAGTASRDWLSYLVFLLLVLVWPLAAALPEQTATRRVVVLKVDGLPAFLVDKYAREVDPATGKSRLPWIHRIFFDEGAVLDNFYVRGISLSVPSWSLLDSGRHLVIHGNVEYDRYTMRAFDYMNFFPFYVDYARSRRVDMPAVETLDEAGIPLFIDSYAHPQRYQSMQLFQRGVHWRTLQGSLVNRFARSPAALLNEWESGFEMSRGIAIQEERDLVAHLEDPRVLYLDYFFGGYDHVAHLTNDTESQYEVLEQLDALAGRLWSYIQASSWAQKTVFVLVSDHGMNTDPGVYSQGYSLVDFFTSTAGGGQHVITNRHPLTEYKLRGLDPWVSEVTTPSPHSFYLRDRADDYPTVLLDLDGNERACVYLRNNRWNEIQILLSELLRAGNKADAARRETLAAAAMKLIDEHRAAWTRTADDLDAELGALQRKIEAQRKLVATLPRKWTKEQHEEGVDQENRRQTQRLTSWVQDARGYRGYVRVLRNLLAVKETELQAGHFRMEDLIPRRAMGDANDVYALQNYAVAAGATAGTFQRVNYFELLTGLRVRNVPQRGVGNQPVDFLAMRVAQAPLAEALPEGDAPGEDGVWLYGSETKQLLLLSRHGAAGDLQLRVLPVSELRQARDGALSFEVEPWSAGFPLRLYEDPDLAVAGDRTAWLNAWHSEREWFDAVHRTLYSNAVIGLHEQFLHAEAPAFPQAHTADDELLARFEQRRRELAQAELLVLAKDHWNFDVRGFNPGGNHGSFFRISTHAVLMFAGAGVPAGLRIETPYDSLSFVPTLMALTGRENQARDYPGPVISELDKAQAARLPAPPN